MPLAHKIAISLPAEILLQMDAAAAERHETRSGLVRMAVLRFLEEQRRQEKIRQYLEGYSRQPETADEVAMAQATAEPLLAGEAWE